MSDEDEETPAPPVIMDAMAFPMVYGPVKQGAGIDQSWFSMDLVRVSRIAAHKNEPWLLDFEQLGSGPIRIRAATLEEIVQMRTAVTPSIMAKYPVRMSWPAVPGDGK